MRLHSDGERRVQENGLLVKLCTEEILSLCHFVHYNRICLLLELKKDLRAMKSANYHLSRDINIPVHF